MKFELTPYQQRRLAHLDVDMVENRHAQVPSWRQSRTAEYQEISAELERRRTHVAPPRTSVDRVARSGYSDGA